MSTWKEYLKNSSTNVHYTSKFNNWAGKKKLPPLSLWANTILKWELERPAFEEEENDEG